MKNEETNFWNDAYKEDPAQSILPDRILDDELKGLPVGTALDLGCGTGLNVLKLTELGWKVTGVDFAGYAIELAKAAAVKRDIDATFVVADTTVWKPSQHFDLVYSTYALPEGNGRILALRTAAAALVPGGTLIVAEWDTSMATVWKHFSENDLVTPDIIVQCLPNLNISKSEVKCISNFFAKDDIRWHGDSWANIALVKAAKPSTPLI